MKTPTATIISVVTLIILGGSTVEAQNDATHTGTLVGIGVALANENGFHSVYLPVVFSSGLRLEPSIGY